MCSAVGAAGVSIDGMSSSREDDIETHPTAVSVNIINIYIA
jgi:hypothetical protein